ncbi:MAG: phosphate ABC transporter permease PstA [Leptolyngbya sp. SIO1D8]|nr:phosphate ABC transporter permease PstA [Leptolyngbya sp. SIO1D8]
MTLQQVTDNSTASPISSSEEFKANLKGRYRVDQGFKIATLIATAIAIAVLTWLLIDVLIHGLPALNWTLLTSFPSRKPEEAGIIAAIAGTLWVMLLVAIFSFPIGVGSGLFLEEFAEDSWFSQFIEINISNLAGVPSIIYGLLGLTAFVQILGSLTGGRSVLSGALTLTLLILPIIIVATREALRAVPNSIRNAGYALGANRWQVIWSHTLPAAFPGVLTGMILALSRAVGETAPLIAIGALTFVPFLPQNPREPFTVLPIQIYNWISRPQKEFHDIAASGIIVLLVVLLLMNSLAIFLRNRFQKAR